MSRYYSYNDFMSDMLAGAEERCRNACGRTLSQYTGVSWMTFVGICNLATRRMSLLTELQRFVENHPIISYVTAWTLDLFLSTEAGQEIAAAFGKRAGECIRELYGNKVLLPTINDVCRKYQERWAELDSCKADIDALMEEAELDLLNGLVAI